MADRRDEGSSGRGSPRGGQAISGARQPVGRQARRDHFRRPGPCSNDVYRWNGGLASGLRGLGVVAYTADVNTSCASCFVILFLPFPLAPVLECPAILSPISSSSKPRAFTSSARWWPS